MADQPNPNPPPADDPLNLSPDGQGKNPADQPQGADTPPANPLEAKKDEPKDEPKVDITTTPEFKAAVTAAIAAKMPQLHRQARKEVAKELNGDEKEGEPTIEQLKTQLTDKDSRLRRYEARDDVEDYVSDKRNNVQVRNMKALVRYIEHRYDFDESGKVSNLKELITKAKSEVPELFGGTSSSIDAGNGSRQQSTMDMNAWMRGK